MLNIKFPDGSIKQFEDNLLKELFLQDLINKNITEEAIKARYNEVNEVLKDKKEFKVKHIVVKTEEEINKVIKELKRNTFEEVAEKIFTEILEMMNKTIDK